MKAPLLYHLGVLSLLFVLVGVVGFVDLGGDRSNLRLAAAPITIPPLNDLEIPPAQETIEPEDDGTTKLQCTSGSSAGVCVSELVTRYVEINSGKIKESFCALSTQDQQSLCAGSTSNQECTSRIQQLVQTLTQEKGAAKIDGVQVGSSDGGSIAETKNSCEYGYRGALTCFREVASVASANRQQAAALSSLAAAGQWTCCGKDDEQCKNSAAKELGISDTLLSGATVQLASITRPDTGIVGSSAGLSGGGSVTGGSSAFADDGVPVSTAVTGGSSGVADVSLSGGDVGNPVVQSAPSVQPSGVSLNSTSGGNVSGGVVALGSNPVVQSVDASGRPLFSSPANPSTVTLSSGQSVALATQRSAAPNSKFESLKTNQDIGRSLVQQFVGDPLNTFVRSLSASRSTDALYDDYVDGVNYRQTPEGQVYTQQVVVYNTATTSTSLPNLTTSATYRSIQEIASDAALSVPDSAPRVEQFAYTLSRVGGPSAASVDTENESFGRLQDLIVEDEAIRALRVAEEEGKRAKNTVFCRTNETSEACQARREEKAKEVERETFVAELEKRVLPETAIEHFVAVYDGWVRPSPAPETRATSTLGALAASDLEETPRGYQGTDGVNFVTWFIDSVSETTKKAASAFADFFTSRTAEDLETEAAN